MTATAYRYYIVEHDGNLYRYEIQDTQRGQRVRDHEGHVARFCSEREARAAVPAGETDPGLAFD